VKFHELTIEERGGWRNEPVTRAAIDALRDTVRAALSDVISYGRGDGSETQLRLALGRHDMAERILAALTEDR
jgi:hypothetical protein